jgi:hypothetical protein
MPFVDTHILESYSHYIVPEQPSKATRWSDGFGL